MPMFHVPMKYHEAFFKKHGQKVSFKKGQFYATPSDDSHWVFFLTEGSVKISFACNDGTDRLLGFFLPGITFAQSGSFFAVDGGGLEYSSVGPSTAYRIPRKLFLDTLESDLAFSRDYVQSLLRNQIYMIERIVYQGEKGVYARTIRWMLFMAKFYGQEFGPKEDSTTITVPLTQETAANFMHITRESTSAAYRKLCKKNLILIQKKLITIPSLKALKKELEDRAQRTYIVYKPKLP